MTHSPRLTESDVRRWIGERSFERGWRYFQQGYILNPRRQGDVLKARCLGSRPQPYHVEVTLGQEGIVAGGCSCPVGGGGHCKHAAALLLTWLHEPDAFLEVEELKTVLDRRSKAELIALICKMVERYPDLEMLPELSIAGDEGAQQPVDPDVIRRQVNNAFHGVGYDWEAAYGVAQDLLGLVELGDGYAQRKDWRSAVTIYQTVAEGILDQYEMVQDEEGELHGIVNGCVEGLGQCLEATEDLLHRETILSALFDVYRWDVDFGGIDMGYQAPAIVLDQATPEERQQVAGWVRAALPVGDSWSANYRRQSYGGFLLSLEEDRLDDEAFLRLCRETKRWHDAVDRLLELGRVEEAVATTREVSDYELLQLADLFVSHDHDNLAEQLIRQRAQSSRDSRLTVWLKERAEARGDVAEALALAETLFWQRPALTGYQELRDLARPLKRWDDLRAAILARLAEEGQYDLLTEVHLEEGEIDRALETVEQVRTWGWGWGAPLRIQVAEAAHEKRPRDAIRLYMEQVEQLIAARGRDNYATAASYLVHVRDLYRRLGEAETWRTLIADLRTRNRRLRALKDELQEAGL